MAERARPMPMVVAEALLKELQLIGQDDETAWLSKPLSVELGLSASALEKPKPGLYLEIDGGGTTPGTSDIHYDELQLSVICVVEGGMGPLQDVIADVRRCLRQNLRGLYNLGDTVTLWDGGWQAGAERVEGRAGIGVATVRARAHYETDDSDP